MAAATSLDDLKIGTRAQIHSIDLMLRLDEQMAFARINDELCRHAERF